MPDTVSETSAAVLSSDHTALILPLEPGQARLVFTGSLHTNDQSIVIEAKAADTPDARIQIEPGQWLRVSADPTSHSYSYQTKTTAAREVRVKISLEEAESKAADSSRALEGTIQVNPAEPLALPSTPTGLSPTGIIGLGIAAILVGVGVARSIYARRRADRDLRQSLSRIRRSADRIMQPSSGRRFLCSEAKDEVEGVVTRAEELVASIKKTRHGLRSPGIQRIRTGVEALVPRREGKGPGQPREEFRSLLGVQTALVERERKLILRLETLGRKLDALLEQCNALPTDSELLTLEKVSVTLKMKEEMEKKGNGVDTAVYEGAAADSRSGADVRTDSDESGTGARTNADESRTGANTGSDVR